jgi:thiosulfate/3-mercaptopyruvate sulfurtransferase
MYTKINKPLVSVDWLQNNLDANNLIILDCTIAKVTVKNEILEKKKQIKGAVFFDIKNTFSDKKAAFPNTVLSPKQFERKAQELGIYNNSLIVCYDDLGTYSSPRVWWLFQLMGFTNVAVLNGGLPAWKKQNLAVEIPQDYPRKKGDFMVNYQPQKIKFTAEVLSAIKNDKILIVDARSKGRFYGTLPEPRNDVKSGHIPNAISLPFGEIEDNGMLKSPQKIKEIFDKIALNKEALIFSCGSGITASILALGATLAGIKTHAVYDGSWTEWGSSNNLPIEV